MSHRPRSGPITLVLWLLLALVGVISASPTAGQSDDDSPTEVTVTLLDQTTWVDPNGEIMVRVAVEDAPPDATVEVTLHERIGSRSDFLRTIERDRLRGRLTDPPLVLGTVDELGDTATARIPIRSVPQEPDSPPRLGIADHGVHPIDIAVYSSDRTYLGGLVTHVVRLPADDDRPPPLEVVLAQSLDASLSHRPDGSIEIDQATRTAWTVTVNALLATDQPLLLSARPETLAALAASGSELDQRLLDDLARAADGRTLTANTFVPIDIAGMVQADLGAEVGAQIELGSEATAAHLGLEPDGAAWLASHALSDPELGALAEVGIDRLVLPRSALARDIDTDTDQPDDQDHEDGHEEIDADDPLLGAFRLVTEAGDEVIALSTDPHLQAHQGRSGDPLLDAQLTLADLALLWLHHDAADPGIAIDLSAESFEPAFVARLSDSLVRSPLAEVVDLDDVVAGRSRDLPRRSLPAAQAVANLSGLRSDLNLARLSIASFEGVFPPETANPIDPEPTETEADAPESSPPDPATSAREFDRLMAVVVSSQLDPVERSMYFTRIAEAMDQALANIDVHARAITLPARDGTVPITLTNESGRPAVVTMILDSDRLDFPMGDRLDVELPPGPTTVDVVVRARASGAFPLDIELESPDGRIALATARYTVRSTAVSGVGVAISIAAVVVLAVWWIRTARRARAERLQDRPG